jgi:hypothetical protein
MLNYYTTSTLNRILLFDFMDAWMTYSLLIY